MSSRLIGSFATTDDLAEVFSDASVLAALLQFETALARAQARLGMIPSAAAEAISRAAAVDHFDAGALARAARKSASVAIPLVSALTRRVREIDPPSSRFVHWGATSQDVIDTAMVLLIVRAQTILARDHARLEQFLRVLSDRHKDSVMLARTLLQPAPPTTFGLKVAGWYGAIHRSWPFADALPLQFGGASGTLASYGSQGAALARELAGELALSACEAPWHVHRDRLATLVTRCGIYTGALGKIARDISLLMQQTVGEVAEAGGGSSAMPNKQNPSGCAIALAAANRTPGLVSSFLSGMIQEHERAAGGWQAEWPTVSATIEATGSALAAMVATFEGLSVYPDRMRANLEATRGVVFAEKASMLLVPRLGREAAHVLLVDAAREAVETARPMREILERGGLLSAEQLADLDRPEDYLGSAEEFRRKLLEGADAAH
jgi:3-carboxy-cis,cis-muconate cycloisomerase